MWTNLSNFCMIVSLCLLAVLTLREEKLVYSRGITASVERDSSSWEGEKMLDWGERPSSRENFFLCKHHLLTFSNMFKQFTSHAYTVIDFITDTYHCWKKLKEKTIIDKRKEKSK